MEIAGALPIAAQRGFVDNLKGDGPAAWASF